MKKAILCLIAAASLLLPVSAAAAPVSVEMPIQEENATETQCLYQSPWKGKT